MLTLNTLEAALAVSAMSVTVNRGSVTRGLRDWAGRRFKPLGSLLNCPYCLSHWGAAVVAVPLSTSLYGWFIQAAAIVALSAISIGAVYQLLLWDEMEIDKLRKEVERAEIVRDELAETLRELLNPAPGKD